MRSDLYQNSHACCQNTQLRLVNSVYPKFKSLYADLLLGPHLFGQLDSCGYNTTLMHSSVQSKISKAMQMALDNHSI